MYSIPLLPVASTGKKSFSERLSMLRGKSPGGKKTVVYFCSSPDYTPFRYRGLNICETLEKSGEWTGVWFSVDELKEVVPFMDKADVVVLIRLEWTEELYNFIYYLKRMSRPVLYDCDDLVFDLQHIQVIANTVDFKPSTLGCANSCDAWIASIAKTYLLASQCDGLVATNAFLGKCMEDCFHKPVRVIKNYLGREQISISEEYREVKSGLKREGPFTIGYFSGTPTHRNDYLVMHEGLMDLMSEYHDIRFQIVGHMDLPGECDALIKEKRILFRPFCDYRQLPGEIAAVDMNVAPLMENIFTNCKSELKYFEAAIVDTITCASTTFSFAHAIRDGVTGYLSSPLSWYDKMKIVYEQFRASELDPMIVQGRQYCLNEYHPDKQLKDVEAVLSAALGE